jgi:ribosomal-protein-alanine N-acetyltransferase
MSDESVTRATVVVRRAGSGDLGPIMAIERASFAQAWPPGTISGDLRHPQQALYLLAELEGYPAAYLGGWLYDVEFHLGSVATAPDYRHRGLAEILVLAALCFAVQLGAQDVILEYRVSNDAAAQLYQKTGFQKLRVRKHYYADDLEDAVEAKLAGLQEPETPERLAAQMEAWKEQYGHDLRLVGP